MISTFLLRFDCNQREKYLTDLLFWLWTSCSAFLLLSCSEVVQFAIFKTTWIDWLFVTKIHGNFLKIDITQRYKTF